MKKIVTKNTLRHIRRILTLEAALLALLLAVACTNPADPDPGKTDPLPLPEYTVQLADFVDGTATVSPQSGTAGTVITITISPDAYFKLSGSPEAEGITIEESEANTFTFTLPEEDVSITVPALVLDTDAVAADAYIPILSAEDMAKIGDPDETDFPAHGKYLLLKNITLTDWVPISLAVNGADVPEFNGNNKTITIASFDADAVTNSTVNSLKAGIFGVITGNDDTTRPLVEKLNIVWDIDGVVKEQTIKNQEFFLGALVGRAKFATIRDISVTGKDIEVVVTPTGVNYPRTIGTLVGDLESSTLSFGVSTVNLKASGEPQTPDLFADRFSYGLVGRALGPTAGTESIIENCHNAGNITVNDCGEAGGIVGFVGKLNNDGTYTTPKNIIIRNCLMSGNVRVDIQRGSGVFAGGIAARLIQGKVEKCVVTGDVYLYNYSNAASAAGGIAGNTWNKTSSISDCYTSGNVTIETPAADGAGANPMGIAGGILGYANNIPTTIIRCYARGTVSASRQNRLAVAGIMGFSWGAVPVISNCVALNKELAAEGDTMAPNSGIYRIAYNGTLSNNHAWSELPFSHDTWDEPTDIGDTAKDGADCAAKPNQTFYRGLGWNFTDVWTMGAEGYPVLRPAN